MTSHRVFHDFGELTREDIREIIPQADESLVQKKNYQILAAALAIGVVLGYLVKRKSPRLHY